LIALRLKKNLPHKKLSLILLVVVISPLFLAQGYSLQLTDTTEYTNNVHTYFDPNTLGKYVVVDKPIFPVLIDENVIPIGQNLTIICPLQEGHNYHIYCSGAWVNTSSAAKTDYDIYVFNPQGTLESSHTEAAGFPEHLRTDASGLFFTPKQSGNYSFLIKNDLRESQGAQQATFMIIENLECNKWFTTYIEGKDSNSLPKFRTSWAYEFLTNSSKVEVYIKVPQTLDMYEARLYLMNDAKSLTVNSYPLPWEPGLYGNVSSRVGGYNFETEGYRGVTYASCEYMGQSMFLNYTSNTAGTKLYQLVLIGEEGSGEIEFMLKTNFNTSALSPLVFPTRAITGKPTNISYVYDANVSLEKAQLSYTIDNWNKTDIIDMAVSNQTCNATIPGQNSGSLVEYRILANDILKNNATTSGNYTVKEQPTLNITLATDKIMLGENITVTGVLLPNDNKSTVMIQFFSNNSTQTVDCPVNQNGTFTGSICPDSSGLWSVVASSPETQTFWEGDSQQLMVMVEEPPIHVKYQLYIIIGLIGALAAGGAVYYLKFRQ
jgi:hypothetical protein